MFGSVMFTVMSSRIFLVSVTGTFEYLLEMSREAKVEVGVIAVCSSWLIRVEELVTLVA